MIIVLSPAKTLDYESPYVDVATSLPQFIPQAEILANKLRRMSVKRLGSMMSISPALAALNSARFKDWQTEFTDDNSRPALFAFKGDVYLGLDAATLSADELQYAQEHLRVLSGLYGVLRPLDRMQPYRLEMGRKLPVRSAKNLYQFWDGQITEAINSDLAAAESEILVNLASNEYFNAIKPKQLNATVLTPVFKDWKNGTYKIISFFAKKARGLMARHIIQNRISDREGLATFTSNGYAYDPESSTDTTLTFLRKQ
jgi:cytoplasmic iron level regulating protein YaaA (DUF328/UPF0246 family)